MRMLGARFDCAPAGAAIAIASSVASPVAVVSFAARMVPPVFVYNLVLQRCKSQSRTELGGPMGATSGPGRDLPCAMPLPQLLSIVESLPEFRELAADLPGQT